MDIIFLCITYSIHYTVQYYYIIIVRCTAGSTFIIIDPAILAVEIRFQKSIISTTCDRDVFFVFCFAPVVSRHVYRIDNICVLRLYYFQTTYIGKILYFIKHDDYFFNVNHIFNISYFLVKKNDFT